MYSTVVLILVIPKLKDDSILQCLLLQPSLLQLQLQEIGLGTARCGCIVALVAIEGVAAFIQSINYTLAFLLFVIVLL